MWFDAYGPTITLDTAFWGGEVLVSVDPALIHHVFTTKCYDYAKSTFTRPFVERVIGRGLVWAEGDFHKLQRKQLVPAFTPELVNQMAPLVYDIAYRSAATISNMLEQSDIVDIHDLSGRTTLDVLGHVALNHEFNALNGGAADIRDKWRQQGNDHISSKGFLAAALLRAFPWIGNLPIPVVQAQGSVKTTVHPLAEHIIQRAKDDIDLTGQKGTDLLSILLRSGEMPSSQMIDNISTFIVAGYDSTSAALSWSLYSMAKHPATQDRLREELLAFGRDQTARDFMSMEGLSYFDAVCKETLRMFPATDAERVALVDDVLPLRFAVTTSSGETVTKVPIRKGQTIIIPLICSNRLNAVWGDGDIWRPERWLDDLPPKDDLPQGWGNLLTFSEGPRSCIGLRLALLELKGFEVEGRYFASLLPTVRGHEDRGSSLPLKVTPVQ